MTNPDIPLLASDMKGRILPWAHTNLGILSEFYADGQWHIGDENQYWYLSPCFAALAATMYHWDNSLTTYRDIAIASVDQGIVWNQAAPRMRTPTFVYTATSGYPGSVFTGLNTATDRRASINFDSGPWGVPDLIGSDDNGSIEAIATFCWILDMLYFAADGVTPSGGLSLEKATAWMKSMKYAADWMIDYNGNPIWYTNGNYVAHQALAYAHLSRLCRKFGDEAGWDRYRLAYELTMQTLVYPFGNNAPASAAWANYGYTVDVAGTGSSGTGTGPTHAAILASGGTGSDGSTETGHFTETPSIGVITPGVTPTFDGAYSMLTLDILATLYTVTRDWRVNYLMNALFNKLETITDYTTYIVNCTGGSRQTGNRGFNTGYLYVISLLGRRSSNRTNLTNAHGLGAWDVQIAPNLSVNSSIAISQIQPGSARQYRIGVATTLHACNLVAARLA